MLPASAAGAGLRLADQLEALVGLFSIGQAPTGERDPYGLRRAALGVIRILVERQLPLALDALLEAASAPFGGKATAELQTFIHERARGYFREHGYTANEHEAGLCLAPTRRAPVPQQAGAG